MKYLLQTYKNKITKSRGFVLPFTLFICGIMLLISTSISTILQKQIYFSQLARESQSAYFAADDAVACVLSVDEMYMDGNGVGIFPYDSTKTGQSITDDMNAAILLTNNNRTAQGLKLLATTLSGTDGIKCAQSQIFNTSLPNSFKTESEAFVRNYKDDAGLPQTENGKTSSFLMKMDLGDGTQRCAKVTVNKTLSYRQIIAQGYSRCDRPDGSVERAVIDTTITK